MKWPGKIKTLLGKRDMNKYWCFHSDHGHNTKDCVTLKDETEALIKRGYLREFVAEDNHNSPQQLDRI